MIIAIHSTTYRGGGFLAHGMLNDRFGQLLATCRDCVGDVSVRPEAD